MCHRDHPEFAIIAKNHHLGPCASSGEAKGVVAVGEFVGCVFHDLLKKSNHLGEFCVGFFNVLDFVLAYQPRNVRKSIHFYREALKNGEAAAQGFYLVGVSVWKALGLLFVCCHDLTITLNRQKATPSMWRGFGANFANTFTSWCHIWHPDARFCEKV